MVRAYKYGFSSTLHTVENMADVADKALFEKILVERHCLHGLLPTKRAYGFLRPRGTLWSRGVHGNGIPRGNGIPMGFPWEWE